ncbi:MAG: MEDS domain-containing protein [Candidatus Bathyarchaeota archaeon]|nr:MEDS domain-containing protein [Candidatus Bathyarchaeota archaeon]
MIESEVLDFVRKMKARDHVILFYTNRKDKQNVLFTFLKTGLDIGEASIYIAGDESTQEIREAMKDFELDVEGYERTHALNIVDYKNWYIIKGKFDISKTISLWKKSLDEAIAKGFKGLRVAGEMACFFKHDMIKELIEYERALHRVLEIPLAAICAYDDNVVYRGIEEERYLRLYLDLISAHSTILFAGPEEAGAIRIMQDKSH